MRSVWGLMELEPVLEFGGASMIRILVGSTVRKSSDLTDDVRMVCFRGLLKEIRLAHVAC